MRTEGTKNDTRRIQKAAKDYRRHGLKILPLLVPNMKEGLKGKEPATPNGVKDATSSKIRFERLVLNLPSYNLAIATGRASGIIVLDIDPRNGGDKSLERLEKELGSLPENAPRVSTGGGGIHIFCRIEPAMPFTRTKLEDGIDVLGDRSYVVAPPSIHATGQRYKWTQELPDDLRDVPRLPRAWRKDLKKVLRKGRKSTARADVSSQIAEGVRNTTLTSIAGKLVREGLTIEQVTARLLSVNSERCRPPLDEGEVRQIAVSVTGYDNGRTEGDPNAPEALAHSFLASRYHAGKHLRFEHDARFWRYHHNHWQPVRDKVLESEILQFIAPKLGATVKRKAAFVNEVMQYLRIVRVRDNDELHFNSDPPNALNLQNGELWVGRDGKLTLKPHRAGSGFRNRLAVSYDPDAKCPEFDQALKDIFNKAERPKELIALWHEIMGYTIQTRRHIPLILILYGSGGNGKTQLIKTVEHLIGRDAVYSGSVGDLTKNRFAFAGLVGKQLFVDDDVQQGTRLPDGILKKISEEKSLTADVKHRDMLNFKVRVIPVLLCNNVPSLGDVSEGMRRRLLVIEFKRRFRGRNEDKELFGRIWQNELPGVLNRALEGLQRVLTRNRLADVKDCRTALDTFLGKANPLKAFVDDACYADVKEHVLQQRLFDEYLRWAKANGISKTLQLQTFKGHLAHLGFGSKKMSRGKVIMGLNLR